MLDVDHRQFFTVTSLQALLDGVFGSGEVEQTAPLDRNLAGARPAAAAAPALPLARRRRARAAALLLPAARGRAPAPPVTRRRCFVSAEPVGPDDGRPGDPGRSSWRGRSRRTARSRSPRPGRATSATRRSTLLEAGLADFEPLLEAVREPRRGRRPAAAAAAPALRRAPARPLRGRPLQPADDRGARGGRRGRRALSRGRAGEVDARPVRGRRLRRLRQREAARPVARRHGAGGLSTSTATGPTRPSAPSSTWCPSACPSAPRARDGPVKGVWPGIGADDRVLLWAGGVWRWLDAITPIRRGRAPAAEGRPGAPRVPRDGPPVAGPGAGARRAPDEAVAVRARARAGGRRRALQPGLGAVRRARGLPRSRPTSGVCAHHDHLEARFSFRTRVLDHFWAGLRRCVSAGDAMGDLVERRGLGRAIAPEDDAGLRRGAARPSSTTRGTTPPTSARVRDGRAEFRWERGGRPLVRLLRRGRRGGPAPRAAGHAGPRDVRPVPATSWPTCTSAAACPRWHGASRGTSRGCCATGCRGAGGVAGSVRRVAVQQRGRAHAGTPGVRERARVVRKRLALLVPPARLLARLDRRPLVKMVQAYLAGLHGLEIGASSHNDFKVDALNVDRYAAMDTVYKDAEREQSGLGQAGRRRGARARAALRRRQRRLRPRLARDRAPPRPDRRPAGVAAGRTPLRRPGRPAPRPHLRPRPAAHASRRARRAPPHGLQPRRGPALERVDGGELRGALRSTSGCTSSRCATRTRPRGSASPSCCPPPPRRPPTPRRGTRAPARHSRLVLAAPRADGRRRPRRRRARLRRGPARRRPWLRCAVLFVLGAALTASTIWWGINPHDEGLVLQSAARIADDAAALPRLLRELRARAVLPDRRAATSSSAPRC